MEMAGGSEMYLPMRQTGDYAAMQLVVRTALPPDSLAAGLRTALRPVDPNLPVRQFQTFQDLVDKAVSPRRFLILLLGGFAAFALLLASLGIYAVISYSVNQRVQEIGIRMALGASPAGLQRGILLRTFGLAMLGLALGTAAARALSTTLGSLLFGVTSGDPATYVGVGALLIVVAAVAGYIPLGGRPGSIQWLRCGRIEYHQFREISQRRTVSRVGNTEVVEDSHRLLCSRTAFTDGLLRVDYAPLGSWAFETGGTQWKTHRSDVSPLGLRAGCGLGDRESRLF